MPSAGEVIRAADAGVHVPKLVDEPVTSSTTLQNDDELSYAVAVGTYVVDVWLYMSSAANAAGDIKVGFSFPTGTLGFTAIGLDNSLASGFTGTMHTQGVVSATSGTTALALGLSTNTVVGHIHGVLTATAAGTLQLMWAQFASNANASTVKAGSHMLVRRVA
jgi:hypothetical protein